MNPRQLERARKLLADRMTELGYTPTTLAQKAHVDPTTVRAILRGDRLASEATKKKIAEAVGWEVGYLTRLATEGSADLGRVPLPTLVREVCNRINDGHDLPDVG